MADEFEPLNDNQDTPMEVVVSKMFKLQEKLFGDAKANIEKAQKRHKKNYDRRHQPINTLQAGQKVLLENSRDKQRKGGKMNFRFRGPFVLKSVS